MQPYLGDKTAEKLPKMNETKTPFEDIPEGKKMIHHKVIIIHVFFKG